MGASAGRMILTPDMLAQHRAMQPNIQDVIWQPLYDKQTYVATTGHTLLTFFATPQGQGTTSSPGTGAAGNKNADDTNLSSAGQLTKGNQFYATGFEVTFWPGAATAGTAAGEAAAALFPQDVYALSKSGIITFKVGSDRVYIQDSPLQVFPPTTRLAGWAAYSQDNQGGTATGTNITVLQNNYSVFSGEPYTIVPILIEDNQGFQCQMTWPFPVPLPSGTNARIGVRLRGYLIRNAQ